MQAMPSDAVSQGIVLVPEPDPSSEHGMETTDVEREQGESGEGVECEEVITVHVESSESLQPSTSQELVKPVSELVEPVAVEMMTSSTEAGGGDGREVGEGVREGEGEGVDASNQFEKQVEEVFLNLNLEF